MKKEQNKLVSNGIYSVMNDEWIKEPVKEDIPEIDKEALDKELKVWEDRYNKIIDNSEEKLDEDLPETDEKDCPRNEYGDAIDYKNLCHKCKYFYECDNTGNYNECIPNNYCDFEPKK